MVAQTCCMTKKKVDAAGYYFKCIDTFKIHVVGCGIERKPTRLESENEGICEMADL